MPTTNACRRHSSYALRYCNKSLGGFRLFASIFQMVNGVVDEMNRGVTNVVVVKIFGAMSCGKPHGALDSPQDCPSQYVRQATLNSNIHCCTAKDSTAGDEVACGNSRGSGCQRSCLDLRRRPRQCRYPRCDGFRGFVTFPDGARSRSRAFSKATSRCRRLLGAWHDLSQEL
jgi:hypothetical protein